MPSAIQLLREENADRFMREEAPRNQVADDRERELACEASHVAKRAKRMNFVKGFCSPGKSFDGFILVYVFSDVARYHTTCTRYLQS